MRLEGPRRGLAAASLLLLACAAREATPPVPVEVPPPRAAPAAAPSAPSEPASPEVVAPAASVDEIVIDLSATGETRMNGEVVATDDGLLDRAREAHARNPDVRAVLRVDGAVKYGVVIQTMDLLRRASITRISLAVASGP